MKPRPCKVCGEPFEPIKLERICPDCKQQRLEDAEEARCMNKQR